MDRFIKRAAITLGGYLYQNLVGLELLCGWLDDPGSYEWVKFEADDDETPRGLDDIIARRTDGSFVFLQVKFTVDPNDDHNALTWEWLLQHKPKGRSLLQKWSNALFGVGVEKVAEAALLTNRLPDRAFHACLDHATRRVSLSRVPVEIRTRIVQGLGSEEGAARFFETFEFRHSHQSYLALQQTLLDRYVPRYTDRHGWNALFREAIDWAIRKQFPPPEGRITVGAT